MKTIQTEVIPSGFTAKVDGSLSVRLTTPELTPMEKAEFMQLQNQRCLITLKPLDIKEPESMSIDKEAGQKSPSERLRGVLYIYHQQQSIEDDFDVFYSRQMDKFINHIKEKLT